MQDGSKRRPPSLSGFEPALWLTERPEISEGRRRLKGLKEFLASHLEQRLHGVATEDAVNERIDDLLDDELFQQCTNLVRILYEEVRGGQEPIAVNMDQFRKLLPGNVQTQTAYAEIPPLLTSLWRVIDEADFEYLPHSHSMALRAKIGIEVTNVCLFILGFESRTDCPSELVIVATLKRMTEELRDVLRLFAPLPGANVSEELVPRETWRDLAQLREEEKIAQLNLTTMLSAADVSGQEIFPPLAEDE